MLAGCDGRKAIDDARLGGADEVVGHNLRGVDVADLLAQVAAQGDLLEVFVDLVAVDVAGHGEVQHRHGDVRGGDADGVAGQLAFELGQGLGDGLGGTGIGEHHVEGGGASTAGAFVEVVDEVLVVGEGVDGFDVAEFDAVFIVDGLEDGGDGVCCA